jgi:hypothetical protein
VATTEMRFLHRFIGGRTEGFIAGRAEGYAQLLVHVLTARFGSLPDGVSDLVYDAARQVAIDQLKTWMARTVTSRSAGPDLRLATHCVPVAQVAGMRIAEWAARRSSRDG